MTLPTTPASLKVIASNTPLIDVRAPVEFAQGSLPGAVNLPLMVDEERHQVGIAYKQQGQQAAIALGERLVSGEIKQARVAAWQAYLAQHPDASIYCFRGGLRSQIAQQWLVDAGIHRPRIEGGWKALRQQLCQRIDEAAQKPMLGVAGLAGCAKVTTRSIGAGDSIRWTAWARVSEADKKVKSPGTSSTVQLRAIR